MSHVGALEECFQALGILACKTNNIKVTIAQDGGIKIILGAMSNRMSKEQGFALLSNLTVKNDHNQVAMTTWLLGTARRHRSNPCLPARTHTCVLCQRMEMERQHQGLDVVDDSAGIHWHTQSRNSAADPEAEWRHSSAGSMAQVYSKHTISCCTLG